MFHTVWLNRPISPETIQTALSTYCYFRCVIFPRYFSTGKSVNLLYPYRPYPATFLLKMIQLHYCELRAKGFWTFSSFRFFRVLKCSIALERGMLNNVSIQYLIIFGQWMLIRVYFARHLVFQLVKETKNVIS